MLVSRIVSNQYSKSSIDFSYPMYVHVNFTDRLALQGKPIAKSIVFDRRIW